MPGETADGDGGVDWRHYLLFGVVSLSVSLVGSALAPNKYQGKQDQILGGIEQLRRDVEALKAERANTPPAPPPPAGR